MNELILPGQDTRLFDKRQEDEHNAAQLRQQFDQSYQMGAPDMPDAQIVFSANKGTFGVAIKGARFVCELPEGYGGKGFELAQLNEGMFVGIQPGKSPLAIDPRAGTAKPI